MDVTKIDLSTLPKFDLIVAGSPCQGFSFAGKQLNFEDPRSKLFFNFIDILNHCKAQNPNIKFLLENVRMKKEYQKEISDLLGVEPLLINSALVSAQNRNRLYWTNIKWQTTKLFGNKTPGIGQPKDRKIFLKDILQLDVDEKYICNKKQSAFASNEMRLNKKFTQIDGSKAICMLARSYTNWCGDYITLKDKQIRRLTPTECCRLQTIPNWAIEKILNCGVSDSQIYKMLGNGWTVEVIVWILSHMESIKK